jgi:hypothetical protein
LDTKLVRRNNSRSVRNPLDWIPSWSEEITAEVSEIPSIGYQAGGRNNGGSDVHVSHKG